MNSDSRILGGDLPDAEARLEQVLNEVDEVAARLNRELAMIRTVTAAQLRAARIMKDPVAQARFEAIANGKLPEPDRPGLLEDRLAVLRKG